MLISYHVYHRKALQERCYVKDSVLYAVHSNFATMGDLQYGTNAPKHNQMSQAGNVIHTCMEFNEHIQNNAVSGRGRGL